MQGPALTVLLILSRKVVPVEESGLIMDVADDGHPSVSVSPAPNAHGGFTSDQSVSGVLVEVVSLARCNRLANAFI